MLDVEGRSSQREHRAAIDSAPSSGSPTICIAENRGWCEPGVRLLIASLERHSPSLGIDLFFPEPSDAFRHWLHAFPQVSLNRYILLGDWNGYDIKPAAMLTLMQHGHEDVVWIDSDIIVTRDIAPLVADLPRTMIVASEEALCSNYDDTDALRTRLWEMEVGRTLPFTINTGVIRLTSAHGGLIEAWTALLHSDVYRAAQSRPWNERPCHLLGDQEVFSALLSSRKFAHFPVHLLRRGVDIIQFFGSLGYTVRERLQNLRRPPAFIHAQGQKPWASSGRPDRHRASFLAAYRSLSPYIVAAREYRTMLDDATWTSPHRPAAILFTALGAGRAPLVGLPHAVVADVVRAGRRLIRRRPG
jgi:hypothetical protein